MKNQIWISFLLVYLCIISVGCNSLEDEIDIEGTVEAKVNDVLGENNINEDSQSSNENDNEEEVVDIEATVNAQVGATLTAEAEKNLPTDVPTSTLIPTSTPIPNTDPNAQLSVGEPWIQDHSIDKMIKLFGKGRLWVYEV